MGLVRECYQLRKSFCLFGYFSKGVLLQQVYVTIDLKVTNNNFFPYLVFRINLFYILVQI